MNAYYDGKCRKRVLRGTKRNFRSHECATSARKNVKTKRGFGLCEAVIVGIALVALAVWGEYIIHGEIRNGSQWIIGLLPVGYFITQKASK